MIVSHTDIFEMPADDLDSQAKVKAAKYHQLLQEAGYEEVSASTFGFFFEYQALAGTARKGDQFGVFVIDNAGILWFQHISEQRAMTADDAYYIYKGQVLYNQLLFNPPGWKHSKGIRL